MRLSNKLYSISLQACWLLFFIQPVYAETVTSGDDQHENSTNVSTEQFLVTEEVRDRELSAEEDPLAQQQSDLAETPEEIIAAPDEFRLYGSVRLRYRDTDSGAVWGDGGSRLGVSERW